MSEVRGSDLLTAIADLHQYVAALLAERSELQAEVARLKAENEKLREASHG